jgi:multicomponent Na+:H+ antiporter subunit D
VDYVPYTGSHVVFQLQLLLFSGLAFFLMLGWLKRTLTITLDFDWFYRRLGRDAAFLADRVVASRGWDAGVRAASRAALGVAGAIRHYHGPGGVLARSWPTGSMAFWTTVMLAAFLLFSFL